ncbi:Quinate/shikimate dehydrogenase [Roseivivax sp. THAF40]|uniref:shikimate dehydrogenase n=1 Tax=unclassified Roseivivax TaxID=2639302 RepID=UPI00126874C1|nr:MULTISPECIES: shikimate dehydrogenase [unclassified Roseivivax]QFS81239.1 Quinate/shikimate dehydrogenase [Roseivivax sp. THAF197b]QFT44968.1 Quinate/shikimate dehydrogenase [Roseivivax sp. THAF40]
MAERAVQDAAVPLRAALLGCGIAASRTPSMHEAEGRAQGLDYTYDLIDMDDPAHAGQTLGQVLDEAEARGLAGLNVTYPFKQDVIGHLHSLSDNARALGAVNTVVIRDGRRIGHNTDLWGFAESFRRGMAGASLDAVLLLGAGGAGSAVAHALMQLGAARLWLHDTETARARRLADSLGDHFDATRVAVINDLDAVAAQLTGVVNATPVGMAKLPGSPFPPHLLRPGLWVADIVYFPLDTALLQAARAVGCRVLPGSGMAVLQAVRAFELITGRAPDPDRMRATFDSLGT